MTPRIPMWGFRIATSSVGVPSGLAANRLRALNGRDNRARSDD